MIMDSEDLLLFFLRWHGGGGEIYIYIFAL